MTWRPWTQKGYCNIVGRLKDMVIRGGENVYPREIEEFLYRHPKIQDVQVFGVPDKRFGEELCAWIMLREGVTATPDETQGVLSRADCALQNSPLHQVRRRVSDDRDRQDSEICHARADDRRTQPARGQDGMRQEPADRQKAKGKLPCTHYRRLLHPWVPHDNSGGTSHGRAAAHLWGSF